MKLYMLMLTVAAFQVACDDDGSKSPLPTPPGENGENPPNDVEQTPVDQMSPEQLIKACEDAVAAPGGMMTAGYDLHTACNDQFPEVEAEYNCREYMNRALDREGPNARYDDGVVACGNDFPGLVNEIFGEDDPCDASGPIAEHCECDAYLAHPEWDWLNQAVGTQYRCGESQPCWLETFETGNRCGLKCDPAFGASPSDIRHMGGLNFHYSHPTHDYETDCSPM